MFHTITLFILLKNFPLWELFVYRTIHLFHCMGYKGTPSRPCKTIHFIHCIGNKEHLSNIGNVTCLTFIQSVLIVYMKTATPQGKCYRKKSQGIQETLTKFLQISGDWKKILITCITSLRNNFHKRWLK